jgi:hypothetical protein
VLSYFAPHKTRGLIVVICLLLEAALGLAPAIVFKAVIDYLARPGGHFGQLALLVVAAAGSVLVGGLISVAESYVTALISQDIVFELRKELFEALIDQPVSFFTKSRSGDMMSRLSNDIDGVEDVVTDTVFGVVHNTLVTVFDARTDAEFQLATHDRGAAAHPTHRLSTPTLNSSSRPTSTPPCTSGNSWPSPRRWPDQPAPAGPDQAGRARDPRSGQVTAEPAQRPAEDPAAVPAPLNDDLTGRAQLIAHASRR